MNSQVLYTGKATASGGGRSGQVTSSDHVLDLPLSPPTEMGGAPKSGATNPEQLFAAGYAACFDSAVNLVARNAKTPISGSSVEAAVSLGKDEDNFYLAVILTVNIPNVSQKQAEQLVAQAHQVCPYSRATRGNLDVQLRATTHA